MHVAQQSARTPALSLKFATGCVQNTLPEYPCILCTEAINAAIFNKLLQLSSLAVPIYSVPDRI